MSHFSSKKQFQYIIKFNYEINIPFLIHLPLFLSVKNNIYLQKYIITSLRSSGVKIIYKKKICQILYEFYSNKIFIISQIKTVIKILLLILVYS